VIILADSRDRTRPENPDMIFCVDEKSPSTLIHYYQITKNI